MPASAVSGGADDADGGGDLLAGVERGGLLAVAGRDGVGCRVFHGLSPLFCFVAAVQRP
jgi:hypothetical protein